MGATKTRAPVSDNAIPIHLIPLNPLSRVLNISQSLILSFLASDDPFAFLRIGGLGSPPYLFRNALQAFKKKLVLKLICYTKKS